MPWRSVARNVSLPLEIAGADRRAAHTAAIAALARMQAEHLADRAPADLSGGERQRAALARALVRIPKLVLLDEPFAALDALTRIRFDEQLPDLVGGAAILFVTHDVGVAIEICDRVAVMYAGQIIEQGTLRDIVRDPRHPYAKGLMASTVHGASRGARLETIPGAPPSLDKPPTACSFAPRCASAQPICTAGPPPDVVIGPGRTARCVLAQPAVTA